MTDFKAVCKNTNVENWKWSEYTERANQYLANNQQPRIINETELREAIQFVQNNPNRICETADGRAKATFVKGYVTEAESIDATTKDPATNLPFTPDQVRAKVMLDYAAFRHLVSLSGDSSFNGTVSRFANDVLDVVSPFYCDHRYNDPPTPEQEPTLKAILNKIAEVKKQKGTPVVIFDLDDTLFDPASSREFRVMNEYVTDFVAKNPGKLSETDIATIRAIKPEEVGFSVALDLQAVFGIKNKEFLDGWQPFFDSHFFRSDYCKDDPVYPGSVEFVNAVFKAGATIVYLTGRQEMGKKPGTEAGMREGSEAALKKNGFPVPNKKNVVLLMKPVFGDDDIAYKGKVIVDIKKMGTVVAALDNEPKADKFYAELTGSIVVDVGMCQFPFYGAKKTLQEIPFEPETVVRISDFRRVPATEQKPAAAVAGQSGGGSHIGNQ